MTIGTAVFVRICREKEEIGINLLKKALSQTGRFSTFSENQLDQIARDAFTAEENNGIWPGMKQAFPFVCL